MERSADRYLHKKFKKQLSIDPIAVRNTRVTPPISTSRCDDDLRNEYVPKKDSTNIEGHILTPKSSISVERPEPAPCNISFAVRCEPAPTWETSEGVVNERTPGGSGGGKYVCSYCNLACSKPSVLQKHIRAHTNERPYPCVSCGFSFKTRSNLYKHCRSRTHANRVLGNRATEVDATPSDDFPPCSHNEQEVRAKPYKPRFHTMSVENADATNTQTIDDEPLNLSSKNRKRCLSEATEPGTHKSLIKELLLKNLYADTNMQCPHCRMYFQTVTELELHKLRSCKGFTKSGARYSRSSSVNVASILTKNKNAFDNIPHLQATFPLKSPGPFLGKTRLVESDKSKSFSYDDSLSSDFPSNTRLSYRVPPLTVQKQKRPPPVKLFGGEVKITHAGGDTTTERREERFGDYVREVSENRVVKCSLQSGGTVLQGIQETRTSTDVIKVFQNHNLSPSIDLTGMDNSRFRLDGGEKSKDADKYTNIMDFSQKAVKMLAPNLKQLQLAFTPSKLSPLTVEVKADIPTRTFSSPRFDCAESPRPRPHVVEPQTACNPMNILVNGKVVRYVPGMPGPVVAEPSMEVAYRGGQKEDLCKIPQPISPPKSKPNVELAKKSTRPNTLALKPSPAHKQHHGLTPTMFNQILISPDTPRVAKKYVQQFHHGTYFTYLGLKSSTKSVYCTLNKTQPFYVPHFNKLSMYSEWRQDTQTDKLYVSGYDSRQRHGRYTTAGKAPRDLVVHSSYKFTVNEQGNGKEDDQTKNNSLLGGYESNEEYTYIRGRGRGRYICDQCGIRCKKPSMLKKHIRTHTNDRPYTCSHCNFSFKTKGNLTKHMKSKAHSKNYEASSSSNSSTQQSGTQSSESDSEDSGMDSSDDSTRQQEHEAAYGLLSLSQKNTLNFSTTNLDNMASSPTLSNSSSSMEPSNFMNKEQVTQINNSSIARNKILDRQVSIINFSTSRFVTEVPLTTEAEEVKSFSQFLGRTNRDRPLTYPYTSPLTDYSDKIETKQSEPKTKPDSSPEVHEFYDGSNDAKKRRVETDRSHSDSEAMDLTMSGTDDSRMVFWCNGNSPPKETAPYPAIITTFEGCTPMELDNSAMETLADVATKQVKLEKNTLAKNVASEFLKFATNHIGGRDSSRESNNFISTGKDVMDFIGKPEENKSCSICSKTFSKPSQLKLHMNVHYLERPFRCDACSVSFRTKGHLQKHERSASHHNKLSSSPLSSSSEPRPFKCSDCNIAFRIHGHLAKHLRSKMHIMKLECLAKIPFGLYAELERANSLLTEINTTDGDQCLESLKALALKVFMNDPGKLNQLEMETNNANTTDS